MPLKGVDYDWCWALMTALQKGVSQALVRGITDLVIYIRPEAHASLRHYIEDIDNQPFLGENDILGYEFMYIDNRSCHEHAAIIGSIGTVWCIVIDESRSAYPAGEMVHFDWLVLDKGMPDC